MSVGNNNQHTAPAPTLDDDKIGVAEKTTLPAQAIEHGDIETQAAEELKEPYYSKLSVWLMILFSGLAIGSDG